VAITKTIVLTPVLKDRLEEHDNQSEVVREALREYLEVEDGA